MSGAPLHYVLALLRRLKSGHGLSVNNTALQHVSTWAGGGGQDIQLKIVLAIQQNLAEARDIIVRSRLTEEAKLGLLSTVDGLTNAFSLGQWSTSIQSHVPAIESSITNFAVITSAIDFEVSEEFYIERDSLVNELNDFVAELNGFEIDDRLKDTARRQILMLIALLQNAEAVGVEVAIASYWELVIKIHNRRGGSGSDSSDNKQEIKLWDTVVSWSERLDALSKIFDVGEKLIPHIDTIKLITGF